MNLWHIHTYLHTYIPTYILHTYATWGNSAPTWSHGPSNKHPSTRFKQPPFKLLVKKVQDTSKTLEVTAAPHGFLPEADIKPYCRSHCALQTWDSEDSSWN